MASSACIRYCNFNIPYLKDFYIFIRVTQSSKSVQTKPRFNVYRTAAITTKQHLLYYPSKRLFNKLWKTQGKIVLSCGPPPGGQRCSQSLGSGNIERTTEPLLVPTLRYRARNTFGLLTKSKNFSDFPETGLSVEYGYHCKQYHLADESDQVLAKPSFVETLCFFSSFANVCIFPSSPLTVNF